MYRDASRPTTFSPAPLTCPRYAPAAAKIATHSLEGLLALAVIVLFFLLEPGKLFAQQTQPADQGWSQNDQYNVQSGPNQQSQQQSDYGQQQPDAQPSYPDSNQAYPQQSYGQAPTPAQPLNASQLEQLVAPIALYPDALVAQVLAASTYPGQVADADQWRQMQGNASPDQIAAGADAQNWDPSVKALVAFPRVLAQMDRNQQWTTDLGNAYYNQPQDVLQAVQVMRRRAQAAGTLESTPQQSVDYDQGYIQLAPVNPEVVYVPTYNPWTVYGEQVAPYPGFSLLGGVESFLDSSPITYGLGIAISAFSQAPWGWLAWGLNWLAESVLFNHSDYYSHSNTVADWGFRHDGLHAYAGRGAFGAHGYHRTADGFHRFGGGYNGNRGQGFGRQGFGRQSGRYAESWRGSSNNGFHTFGGGYHGTQRQAHNYTRAPENWRQFNRGGSRSSWSRATSEGFRSSARTSYARSVQPYRAPASGFQRSEFGRRSSGTFASNSFSHSAGRPSHSGGGLHLFGGGHEPKRVSSRGSGGFHMGGGGHAPKSFHSSGRSFGGGGHSHGGGGHSGGHGGKHRR